MVTAKFTSSLRRDLGREEDQLEAGTVGDLVGELERRHGKRFARYADHCRIFVNGTSTVHLDGRETRLLDGDVVLFTLAVVGG
jgi:molybdopterin converting factor small subunit